MTVVGNKIRTSKKCLNCGGYIWINPKYISCLSRRKFCSHKCSEVYNVKHNKFKKYIEKRKQTNLIKYGTEWASQAEQSKQKQAITCIERYGTKSSLQNKKVIEKKNKTNMDRYGTIYPSQTNQCKQKQADTCLVRYGTKSSHQNKEISKKSHKNTRSTIFKKYGVDHNMQVPEFYKKQRESLKNVKPYTLPSGQTLLVRGYETQLLDFVLKNNILKEAEIQYEPFQILYSDRGKNRYYHPDFFIPKLNLIVEVKSDYTEKLDKNVELKKRAVIHNGYRYIRVINNDFEELKEVLL